jgi:hypothetical protein
MQIFFEVARHIFTEGGKKVVEAVWKQKEHEKKEQIEITRKYNQLRLEGTPHNEADLMQPIPLGIESNVKANWSMLKFKSNITLKDLIAPPAPPTPPKIMEIRAMNPPEDSQFSFKYLNIFLWLSILGFIVWFIMSQRQ